MTAYTLDGETYERLTCGECGIIFWAPQYWVEVRRDRGDHGREFHCPNGHTRIWKESALDRVTRERDRAKQELARVEEEAKAARERAEKAEKATKLLKKRTAAGTCPCCKRTFSNMSNHMRHKHPEYVAENVVPLQKQA